MLILVGVCAWFFFLFNKSSHFHGLVLNPNCLIIEKGGLVGCNAGKKPKRLFEISFNDFVIPHINYKKDPMLLKDNAMRTELISNYER